MLLVESLDLLITKIAIILKIGIITSICQYSACDSVTSSSISESGIILFSAITMKLFEYSNGFNTSSDAAKILTVFTPSPLPDISSLHNKEFL